MPICTSTSTSFQSPFSLVRVSPDPLAGESSYTSFALPGLILMDHYTKTGRPFPRGIFRVLSVAAAGPVTNRAISNSLMMSRQEAGSYLSRCFRRGYMTRSGNIYQLSAAGRFRLNFLRQNDPDSPATCDNLTTGAVHQGNAVRRLQP